MLTASGRSSGATEKPLEEGVGPSRAPFSGAGLEGPTALVQCPMPQSRAATLTSWVEEALNN